MQAPNQSGARVPGHCGPHRVRLPTILCLSLSRTWRHRATWRSTRLLP